MSQSKTVLVVDDNDQNLYMIEVLLKSQNYDIVTAKDGQEALALAKKEPPFLVISDILMPIMDGFVLCQQWKQDDILKKIPFVFYTATYTDLKDEEYALSLGADKFIRKPMEPDLFLNEIGKVIEEQKEKNIGVSEPLIKDEEETYRLYSSRLVNKLEKKMFELEEEIEKRKNTEIELLKAKKEWQDIFQAISNPAFIIDSEYNILHTNRTGEELLKESASIIGGGKCYNLIHNSATPPENCPIFNIHSGKITETGEFEFESGECSYLMTCTPVYDENRKLEKIIHISTDITNRKIAEKSLVESEEKFKGVFHNAHIGIAITDENGALQDFNEEFREIMEYERSELKQMNITAFTYDEDLEKELAFFKKMQDGSLNTYRMQKRYITKNRSIKWVELTVSAVRNSDGQIDQFISTVLDIDEQVKALEVQRQLEAELRQSQKIESIGNLAGGIAHDFNNILSAIIGYAELSLYGDEKNTPITDYLNEIYSAGMRAKELVQQILTFARKTDGKMLLIKPDLIADEVLKLLKPTTQASINIETNLNVTARILGDPTQLHQLFMNICTNSIQAMDTAGGTLRVSLEDSICTFSGELEDPPSRRECVQIKISDTGMGIPKKDIESIFDPYFTTKEQGKGTGLGLSTVHGIVKRFGGNIFVESEEKVGTTFTINIPSVKNDVEEELVEGQTILRGNERILFIDDEPSLAKLGQTLLSNLGYNVTTFTSSVEALERFRSAPDSFDLVITDMAMPHLSGDVLSSEMLKIRSDIPIIMVTGFSDKIDKPGALKIGIKRFAFKPLDIFSISRIIRELL